MNVPSKNKGFTIIEVVLVLAIAGLIFLVVFLALPALQRGQRDNQRKQDLGRLMSQVTAYQANTQGMLPNGAWDGTFKSNYLTVSGSAFADPTNGSTYTLVQETTSGGAGAPSTLTAGNIYVYPGLTCAQITSTNAANTSSRTFAAAIYQEQGVYTCQNN